MLFCSEAPEMFCGRHKLHPTFHLHGGWVHNDWITHSGELFLLTNAPIGQCVLKTLEDSLKTFIQIQLVVSSFT